MHDTNLLEDQPIAWTPTPDVIERAQLTRFMRQVGVTTWEELYEYSIRDVEKFTEEVLKFLDIKFDPPYEKLLDTSDGVEFPRWLAARPETGDGSQETRDGSEATGDGRQESVPPAVAGGSLANAESDVETRRHESEPGAIATGSPVSNAERGVRNAASDIETRRHESVPEALATGPADLGYGISDVGLADDAPTAGLNITTMCLDRWQTDEMRDQPALIWEGESGEPQTLTYKNLFDWVGIFSAALRTSGIKSGDAIGIHLPMIWETVVGLLAINRIGAIAVPVFSGYGVEAIASRLNAVGAKALFTCSGFRRRGKWVNALDIAAQAVMLSPSVRTVFTMDVSADQPEEYLQTYARVMEQFEDREITCRGEAGLWFSGARDQHNEAEYDGLRKCEPTSAEDPLIILYTSGTTGKPKGIAHTHASFPIKAAQDMAFGTDVGRGTRICWYTDIGWMMGPWLIYGALINGATICLYDGAPDYPTPDRIWEFCAKHKVEVLGISPTLVRALAAHEEATGAQEPRQATGTQASRLHEGNARKSAELPEPPSSDAAEKRGVAGGTPAFQSVDDVAHAHQAPYQRHDLSSLRMFASTGEPWNPAPWWWLFEKVGNSKLPIINYSGGTEIAGGILMGNPLLPIKPCSFPAPCPGMDVDILDEEGKSVEPGKVGELVIKQPWIGMARGFWQESERYLDTYWRRFPNIWVHGDWAMRDKDGHWFILGRSDDTLKVAGKRVGPAEVESLLVAHPLVTEAAVIGVPDEAKGTAMVAFCVLNEGGTRTSDSGLGTSPEQLEADLRSLVAKDMGKPLAPSKVHFVSALPKTRNAKVMRRVLRAAYLGEDPGDLSALENPNAVEEISKIRKPKNV